jgi:hypothetical protein
MTWKEFKDEVTRKGVRDEDIVAYIDCQPDDTRQLIVSLYITDDKGRVLHPSRFSVE